MRLKVKQGIVKERIHLFLFIKSRRKNLSKKLKKNKNKELAYEKNESAG